MKLNQLNGCQEHNQFPVGDLLVSACDKCRRVEWRSRDGEVDPSEGMAALFGSFELVGTLDALGSPAPEVLVYAPPSVRKRRNLLAFPKRVWVKAAPDLWLTHDGENLLLATNHRLLFENLTRGA
ncbi:MAG: hypothetical protein DWQ40_12300 [Actinobacteria bacterium]|nr:MAG: hypothetical protein DWQ40_12300 [Actinomycetota bacterium]REK33762.1 MAG: hypothetical protein DWQ20_07385 [Actinomycetota bacterium]